MLVLLNGFAFFFVLIFKKNIMFISFPVSAASVKPEASALLTSSISGVAVESLTTLNARLVELQVCSLLHRFNSAFLL